MALDLFKTLILGAAKDALRKKATLARSAYMDLSGTFNSPANTGDQVRINYITRPAIEDVTPGHSRTQGSDPQNTSVVVRLDQWKGTTPYVISDRDSFETKMAMAPNIGRTYGQALADHIERAGFQTLNTHIATSTQVTFGGSSDKSLDDLAKARAEIVKRDADSDRMICIVNADEAAGLLGADRFVMAESAGQTGVSAQVSGMLGRRQGFQFMESNNIPSFTRVGSGTFAVNGGGNAVDAGETVLPVDGVTTGVATGEIFTIAGVPYVAAVGITGVSGNITLDRPLDADAADNAVVTRVGAAAYRNSYAMDPMGLAFAMRPTVPPGGPFGLDANIQSYTDPETGFSICVEVERQNAQSLVYMRALYGWTVVRAEHIQRLRSA